MSDRREIRILFGMVIACALTSCATVTFNDTAARGGSTTFVVDSSSYHFSPRALDDLRSTQPDSAPAAWGRYVINRAGSNAERNGSRELTASELNFLRTSRIRIVPVVAPDQKTLSGTFDSGRALATEAAAVLSGVVAGFGSKTTAQQVLVFLDVEGDRNPLNRDFLLGWCAGIRQSRIGNVSFVPALYTNAGISAKGVRKLLAESNAECKLGGLWLANYLNNPALPAKWKEMHRDSQGRLTPIPAEIPIYLWQYSGGNSVDWNMVDPDLVNQFELRTLALWCRSQSSQDPPVVCNLSSIGFIAA